MRADQSAQLATYKKHQDNFGHVFWGKHLATESLVSQFPPASKLQRG